MIYWDNDSLLLATGLSLKTIAQILSTTTNDTELELAIKNQGQQYLRRYQVVKEYRNLIQQEKQKLPIIPIIAGIPGIGKTALAKELSAAINIGLVIGGDILRAAVRLFILKEENKVFFSSIYNTWQFFGDKSKQTIIEGYKTQAKIMNYAMEMIIADRGIRDGESIIAEYLHFLPSQFSTEVLTHPSVMPLILVISDEEIYESRIYNRTKYSHLGSSGKRLVSQMDVYLTIQDYLCKEATQFAIPIISIDNFKEGFNLAYDYLIDKIAYLNKIKQYKKNLEIINKISQERDD